MRLPLIASLVVALPSASMRADDLDSPMYRDPEIVLPKVERRFPAGLADRWLEALARPEADLQAQAALAIAAAHERGMPGLAATVGPLQRALERAGQSSAVRAAAARALVALDARAAAPALLAYTAADFEMRDLIETALVRWDYRPAREVWLARLAEPPPYRPAHSLAMRSLATVGEASAADRLQAIVRSDAVTGPVRLEAARALGVLRTAGSEADAEKLVADSSPRGIPSRIAAAALLRKHSGEPAVALLHRLARDPEPAVAAPALSRLIEIDPKLVLPLLPAVLGSPGADARTLAVDALGRVPAADHVTTLGDRLSDQHTDVRRAATRALLGYANHADLRAAVIDRGVRALGAADWRGQEQAAVILARLAHRPAAPRLVDLIRSDRPEAAVAAAWGLRELGVPNTLPAALDHVKLRHAQLRDKATPRGFPLDQLDRQLAQLVQFLGAGGYRPADPELRALFPRVLGRGMPPPLTEVGPETRAAALWALGRLHAGKPDAALIRPIQERLTGDGPLLGKDDSRVRRMAAVALARIGARQLVDVLREQGGEQTTLDAADYACRWAVAQLIGQPLPPPGVYELPQTNWFLIPIK